MQKLFREVAKERGVLLIFRNAGCLPQASFAPSVSPLKLVERHARLFGRFPAGDDALVEYLEKAENGYTKVHYETLTGYVMTQYLKRPG